MQDADGFQSRDRKRVYVRRLEADSQYSQQTSTSSWQPAGQADHRMNLSPTAQQDEPDPSTINNPLLNNASAAAASQDHGQDTRDAESIYVVLASQAQGVPVETICAALEEEEVIVNQALEESLQAVINQYSQRVPNSQGGGFDQAQVTNRGTSRGDDLDEPQNNEQPTSRGDGLDEAQDNEQLTSHDDGVDEAQDNEQLTSGIVTQNRSEVDDNTQARQHLLRHDTVYGLVRLVMRLEIQANGTLNGIKTHKMNIIGYHVAITAHKEVLATSVNGSWAHEYA